MKFVPVLHLALVTVLAFSQTAVYADDTDIAKEQSIASLSPSVQNTADSNTITLQKPELKALITVDERLDPYKLEARSQQLISLPDVLHTAIDQNLDIGISHTQEKSQQWKYLGSLGKFLPDLNAGYSLYGIEGNINIGAIQFPNQIGVASAGFTYNGYQGGKVLFGALQNRNLLHAYKAESRSTLSNVLLSTTQNYYNLLLNEALLKVRIEAVETSAEQYRMDGKLFNNGLATGLDVLQARTQLSRDRQDLIDQQVARRASAIQLATILNSNLTADLMPTETTLRKIRLVSHNLNITDLVGIAIENRAELKQSEELRLAAKKAIAIAAAPLQPTLKLSGTAYGIGKNVSDLSPFYTLAMTLNWTLKGLGSSDISEIQSAKWQSRQSLLNANKVLLQVLNDVHNSFILSSQAERKITEATDEVLSAKEELRLAKIRFEKGLGNNIDVISAQRDLTAALVSKAQSIINFNMSQAQLLHDIGLITVENLTSDSPIEKSKYASR